jgi:hypothetical protein
MTEFTRKMQLMTGMCAAKALMQPYRLYTILTQILRSRGFDACMPAIFLSKCSFWVHLRMQRQKKRKRGITPLSWKSFFQKL